MADPPPPEVLSYAHPVAEDQRPDRPPHKPSLELLVIAGGMGLVSLGLLMLHKATAAEVFWAVGGFWFLASIVVCTGCVIVAWADVVLAVFNPTHRGWGILKSVGVLLGVVASFSLQVVYIYFARQI